VSAKELVNALDHVLHDLFRRVPDAKVLPELRIKCFKEGLVEICDGFIFAEGIEKGRLYAVEGFTGEIKDFLQME
jgi:hypothetical protein